MGYTVPVIVERGILLKKVALFILITLSTGLFAQFWEEVPSMVRPDLADAYYKAGEQYEKNKETRDKGEAYKAMALKIYPDYKPGQGISSPALPEVTPEETKTTPAEEISSRVRQKNLKVEKLVQYQFTKMVRAIINENPRMLESVLADRIFAPGYENGYSRARLISQLPQVFAQLDLESVPPSDIYNFSSMRVSVTDQGNYLLKINTTGKLDEMFKQVFVFWESEQHFTFVPQGSSWVLAGAGYFKGAK